ncbi:hypothetical protein VTK56DRAFT_1842 [Thermocarpiscus australiensis]
MLNKKSAFKPKAGIIRRAASGPGSQGAQRLSSAEQLSKTPAPQEPSSSSQTQPAPDLSREASLATGPPVSGNGEVEATLQTQRQIEAAATEPALQGSASRTSPSLVAEGRDESSVPEAASTTTPDAESTTAVQSGKPESQGAAAAQEPILSGTTVAGTDGGAEDGSQGPSAVPAAAVPAAATPSISTTSADNATSLTGTTLSTHTPGTASGRPPDSTAAQAPSPTPNEQAPSLQDQPGQAAAPPAEDAASVQVQPSTEANAQSIPAASATVKPKRGRKRKTDATASEDTGEQSSAAPRRTRARKTAAKQPDEEGNQETPAASRARRARKRRQSSTENGETEEDGEGSTPRPKKKPPKRQREVTPEDAEDVEIDVTQVKMADLAKDLRIGKKFSLHDELMKREREKRLRYNGKRKKQENGSGDDAEKEEGESAGTASAKPDTTPAETPAGSAANDAPGGTRRTAPIGEQYQIIDGEIVLDHRSLQVDRHARAREEAGELLEVEENDFTHHTTSATYLRRNLKPQQWTDDETELFYQALQAFGTDFDTICRLFKGKTRKHIKLKFNREERVAPDRINAALVGQKTVAMSMDEYQRRTGQDYEPAEAIYAEQRRAQEEFEARQRALADEKAEEVRRKKEEVLAQLNTSVEGGHGGEGAAKKGRRGRKKKAADVVGL